MRTINGVPMLSAREVALLLDLDEDMVRAWAAEHGTAARDLPDYWVRRGVRARKRVAQRLGHAPDMLEALAVLAADRDRDGGD